MKYLFLSPQIHCNFRSKGGNPLKKHKNSFPLANIITTIATAVFLFIGVSFAVIYQNNNCKDNNRLQYVPGEIIVKFKEDISELAFDVAKGRKRFSARSNTTKLEKLNKKYKVRKIERVVKGLSGITNRSQLLEHVKSIRTRKFKDFREEKIPDLHNIYLIKFESNADVKEICKEYGKTPNVEYAEPNYLYYTSETIPDDPDFSQQWALDNTGQTSGTVDADIDAPEAWDIERGSPEVVIAVIDTGVDWDHPDLADNVWVNPGEDINKNGVADEDDFNGVDDDENGFIDDVRGWDFVTVVDTGG